MAVAEKRAPERNKLSSLPSASRSSMRPSVARTRWMVRRPLRVFSTICRYRRLPEGLMRKNMQGPGETPQHYIHSPDSANVFLKLPSEYGTANRWNFRPHRVKLLK